MQPEGPEEPDSSREEDADPKEDSKDKATKPKTKQRTLGYVIEMVKEWRRLYNGYFDDNGEFTRMELDKGALKLGIPKKTLDDYLGLIRDGSKMDYDFNSHINESVSDLRNFIKAEKKKTRTA